MAANEVLARVFHLMEQSSDTIRGIRNMKRQSSRPILFGKLLHFFLSTWTSLDEQIEWISK